MKTAKSELMQKTVVRRGDGEMIRVIRELRPKTDGSSEHSVGLDMEWAPVPTRRYVADTAFVDRQNEYVRLMFGQAKIGIGLLRSLVVIHMVPGSVRQFLDSCRDFGPSARKFAVERGLPVSVLQPLSDEPPQTVALTANILAVAFADWETAMDFYSISPWAIRELANPSVRESAVDPVVRVQLPTSLFIAMLNRLDELAPPRVASEKER
jgi:hypothetical protein